MKVNDSLFEVGEQVWTVSGSAPSGAVEGPFTVKRLTISETHISCDCERTPKKGWNDEPTFNQKVLFKTAQEAEVARAKEELEYHKDVVLKYQKLERESALKLQNAIASLPPHRREAVEATAHKHEDKPC